MNKAKLPTHVELDVRKCQIVKNSVILSFAALFVTSGLETIGNTSGIMIASFDREANERETSGAILADILFPITDPRDIEKAKEAMLG